MAEVPCKLGGASVKLRGDDLVFELDCIYGPSSKKTKKSYLLSIVLDSDVRLGFIRSVLKLFDVKNISGLRHNTCVVLVDDKTGATIGLKRFEFDGGDQVLLDEFSGIT